MSNKNLSLLFTGQGSQFAEMGIEFINKYDWVKERYSISSKILGYDLLEAQSEPSLLNLTQYSQPMIFVFSSIVIDLCKDFLLKNFSKITLAGHSLGEYCALYFAEALNFEEMLEVVKSRGDSMSIVSDPNKYVMYAILKKDDLKIDETLFGNGIYLANINSDRQVVICGLKDTVNQFKEQNPIGKFIPLNVSAPFHSDLMKESAKIFSEKIKNNSFKKIKIDLISNHKLINYKEISEKEYSNQLSLQIHSTVMWSETIKAILNEDINTFIEIGPKKTLLNFLPKDFQGEKYSFCSIEEIKNV
ncbi:acyltransferase domain-containing protein [Alphaproteobacteria bacterium]|nr:acyltransferase domain-containing protein [Alphaproteobacteria bacterium]